MPAPQEIKLPWPRFIHILRRVCSTDINMATHLNTTLQECGLDSTDTIFLIVEIETELDTDLNDTALPLTPEATLGSLHLAINRQL